MSWAGQRSLRSRTCLVALGALAALTFSACLPAAPLPEPSIPFPGLPAIAAYEGDECRTVLVIGDSMAVELAADLDAVFEGSGRCVDVVNRAVGASSVVEWGPGGPLDAAPVFDEVRPDVVVAHFIGNATRGGLTWSDPTWLDQTTDAALAIADAALSDGISVYWALPPKSAWACNWMHESARAFAEWHTWVRDTLWTTRPVHPLDLRTPFGGETYSRWFTFPDGSVHELRQVDCVHFSDEGGSIAASATAAAAQGEWTTVTPPVEDPTTTTTAPEPTTTTTTVPDVTTTSTTSPG